jgi:hypothetical protein
LVSSSQLFEVALVLVHWEIIAANLSKAGWSYGYVSALDRKGAQSGLWTLIATESVSLSVRMKS